MRFLFSILILLPVFSLAQVSELIKKFQANFKVTEDQAPIEPQQEEIGKAFWWCNNEVDATVDWKEWTDYLTNSLFLDDQSLDTIPPGTYQVVIRFGVDKKGRISDVSVIKDPGFGLGLRVKKVVENYGGRWSPGKINGRSTFSHRAQPVTFIVDEPEECVEEVEGELTL